MPMVEEKGGDLNESVPAMDSSGTSNYVSELQNLSPAPNTYMNRTFYRAASQGNTRILRRMSRDDLRLQLTPKRNTVLHVAVQFGQLECVQWIIRRRRGLSVLQWPNLKGDTPLHLAAREGHSLVVRALIDAAKALPEDIESGIGADKGTMRMANNENDTALHEAVRYHHPDVVKLLIEEDPDFTYGANFSGGTPLYMAAERGFGDLVELIIDNTRTPPAHTGPMGRTALHAAVISTNPEMVEKILEWKADLTKEVGENGWSPLHCAAYLGCTPIMVKLLNKTEQWVIYLGVKNDDNKTALHIAAIRGHFRIVRLLVSRCPDCCEQVDINGNNAFHLLMLQRRSFTGLLNITWFRMRGLLNEKNVEGQTPLHVHADSQMRCRKEFIKNSNVDKMTLNNKNLTALDLISSSEDLVGIKRRIVSVLKRAKANAGPLGWQKTMNNDDDNKKGKPNKGGDLSSLKQASDRHLIVATLVATVSFTAGFTLPGGYSESNGIATLTKKSSFKAFLVADVLAVALSLSAVLLYFSVAFRKVKTEIRKILIAGFFLTKLGIGAMVVAFMAGLSAGLPDSSGIAIFTVIIFSFCLSLNFHFY